MDRYGLDLFLPTAQRNATVIELLNRGCDRMFLSRDFDIGLPTVRLAYPLEVLEQFVAAGAATDWSMTFHLNR